MTYNRPDEDALCWLMNGTYRTVDVYVNYHDEPYATVKPEEDQPAFSVDSDADGIYGTYTFEAREKDDPDGEALASASVELDVGDGYTALFHEVGPDDFRLSVYEADLSPSAASRFEIHHGASPEEIQWRLAPNAGAGPRAPVDERRGTLQRGQWQQALDVTENDYRLEVLVDDEVVAYLPDLDLETERTTVCYVVGDPRPDMGADQQQAHVFSQRYQIPSGPERADETTPPEEPHSTTDDNQPVEFAVDPPDLYETNRYEVEVEATDPDGVVSGLAIHAVDPDVEGFRIHDDSVQRATEIGGTTTAGLRVPPTLSPGGYDVRLVANPEGLGERAYEAVSIEIDEITVERLWDRVEHYHGNGAVTDEVANELYSLLVDAGATPVGLDGLFEVVGDLFEFAGLAPIDETEDPLTALEAVSARVTEARGDGIDEPAADRIETETETLLERLRYE